MCSITTTCQNNQNHYKNNFLILTECLMMNIFKNKSFNYKTKHIQSLQETFSEDKVRSSLDYYFRTSRITLLHARMYHLKF